MKRNKSKLQFKIRRALFNAKLKTRYFRPHKPTIIILGEKDRQIGKTTKLVELVNKDPKGILVVSNCFSRDYVFRNFNIERKRVYTIYDIPKYCRPNMKNLYIDEGLIQPQILKLFDLHYNVRVLLRYKPQVLNIPKR